MTPQNADQSPAAVAARAALLEGAHRFARQVLADLDAKALELEGQEGPMRRGEAAGVQMSMDAVQARMDEL